MKIRRRELGNWVENYITLIPELGFLYSFEEIKNYCENQTIDITEDEIKICNMTSIHERYPNGESMQDMYDRVKYLIDSGYFLDKNSSLIVTHRGIINMMYFIFNNEPLTMNKKKFGVSHASVHELDIEKRKIKRIY